MIQSFDSFRFKYDLLIFVVFLRFAFVIFIDVIKMILL